MEVGQTLDEKLKPKPDVEELNHNVEKRAILRNVIVISTAFMILFTAFQSMASLQSSINKDDNIGTYSLSVIYASLILSSMFVPSYCLQKIGSKWTMVAAMISYSLYISAQFYPKIFTLIPAAVLLGFAAAPLWIAKCAYLTKAGQKYAELCHVPVEPVIVKFFGIFFLFFQTSSVWGNIISSWALGIGRNDTDTESIHDLTHCGINYCPEGRTNVTIEELSEEVKENFSTTTTQIYTLAGVYLGCSLLSPIIISLLVNQLSRFTDATEGTANEQGEQATGCSLLVATLKHMKNPYQKLIIPLTIWSGLEQGFFGADFTAGYVTCGWGVQNVGYVMITYGVFDAVLSFSFGYLIKLIGRIPIFMAGAVINYAVIGVMFNWTPNPDEPYVFFILAGLWGMADAVWQTQINALYGVLFHGAESSAGFSNYRLWESAGFIFAYILQTQVCIYAKLWIMVATLLVGMFGYVMIEVSEYKKAKSSCCVNDFKARAFYIKSWMID